MSELTRKDLTTIFLLLYGNPKHFEIMKKIEAMIDKLQDEDKNDNGTVS